jgi:hypothetical protein
MFFGDHDDHVHPLMPSYQVPSHTQPQLLLRRSGSGDYLCRAMSGMCSVSSPPSYGMGEDTHAHTLTHTSRDHRRDASFSSTTTTSTTTHTDDDDDEVPPLPDMRAMATYLLHMLNANTCHFKIFDGKNECVYACVSIYLIRCPRTHTHTYTHSDACTEQQRLRPTHHQEHHPATQTHTHSQGVLTETAQKHTTRVRMCDVNKKCNRITLM